VEFTKHLTHDTGTFPGRLVIVHAHFIHGVEDPAVYGFKSVSYIWEGSSYDHTHGVVDIGSLHLLLNIHRDDTVVVPGLFRLICFVHSSQLADLRIGELTDCFCPISHPKTGFFQGVQIYHFQGVKPDRAA
jgi:hypothetical protein